MKIPNKTNDLQEKPRPEDSISTVLSDPPTKKRSKSKKNRDTHADSTLQQLPKTAAPQPSAGEEQSQKGEESTGRSIGEADDQLRCADKKKSTGPSAGGAEDELRCAERRMGQFKPGQSGNPKGRPKGSFNKATLAARAMLGRNSELLTEAAIKLAISGSPIAIKLCMERLISIPTDSPINLNLPPDPKDPSEVYASHNAVLRAVAEGKITPAEGRHLSAIVDARRRSWESVQLDARMTNLEANLPKRK